MHSVPITQGAAVFTADVYSVIGDCLMQRIDAEYTQGIHKHLLCILYTALL